MPRENSISDDGRSLTPDFDEVPDPQFTHSSSQVPESSSQATYANVPNTHIRDATDATLVQRAKTHHFSTKPTILTSALHASFASSSLSRSKTQQPIRKPRQSTESEKSPKETSAFIEFGSLRSPISQRSRAETAPPPIPGAALAHFRACVRKIIISRRGFGAEPGVDPRRSTAYVHYGHIHDNCNIDIIDYSSVRSSFGRMENQGFVEYLGSNQASMREPWVKVRWINIGGVSWDVMSALALKYNIHPLALEDVLHQRSSQARSKSDYYQQHLFIRILRHCLGNDEETGSSRSRPIVAPAITNLPRSASPVGFRVGDEEDNTENIEKQEAIVTPGSTLKGSWISELMRLPYHPSKRPSTENEINKFAADVAVVEKLKQHERVNVQINPLFLFLFRDGTVISITSKVDPAFTAPIISRIRQRDTVLRQTADPSLLIQSLLDLVVDQALGVVDEFQRTIIKLEHDILIRTQVKTVRQLHIISADLTSHKRTLEPIKTLIYGLRRYDIDRCAALVDAAGGSKDSVEGFMSHKAKIYLADVFDHMDYILSSMDMFSGVSENLISYTFNMASYEMNNVMRRLTLATIIFLPLTLLTGYFGMNFSPQWATDTHSDVFFWIIALPVMAFVIPAFLWGDIRKLVHFCKKKWAVHTVENSIKKNQ